MIGSDWPVCTVAATYRQTMGFVMDWMATWPAAERDAVLGGNAARFWRVTPERSSRGHAGRDT
jgi:L-fuconolactonase